MKKLFCLITLLSLSSITNAAEATTRNFACRVEHNEHMHFTAILDSSNYQAGSGFFDVKYANLVDDYASARNMACSGHNLDEISCVGFWFDMPDAIVKIDIRKSDNKISAVFETLSGRYKFGNKNQPLNCMIE